MGIETHHLQTDGATIAWDVRQPDPMTDLPPDFWMVPDQPQHVVCGTETALGQAILDARALVGGWDKWLKETGGKTERGR